MLQLPHYARRGTTPLPISGNSSATGGGIRHLS
jgi:hypothetical protein